MVSLNGQLSHSNVCLLFTIKHALNYFTHKYQINNQTKLWMANTKRMGQHVSRPFHRLIVSLPRQCRTVLQTNGNLIKY